MRRVPEQPKYYRKGVLQQGTFLPRKFPRDDDGLSVSRAQTTEHPEFFRPDDFKKNCTDETMKRTAGVLLMPVDLVREIVGPGVRPEPTEADLERGLVADPGHSVIPELGSKHFDGPESTEESRERMRKIAAILAHRLSDASNFAILPGSS
jgi:hypothetical protein